MAEVVDPVCGMTIESSSAAGESRYNGTTFFFCTTACKREFEENPAKYHGKAVAPQNQVRGAPRGAR